MAFIDLTWLIGKANEYLIYVLTVVEIFNNFHIESCSQYMYEWRNVDSIFVEKYIFWPKKKLININLKYTEYIVGNLFGDIWFIMIWIYIRACK